jgi:hypothetical protein
MSSSHEPSSQPTNTKDQLTTTSSTPGSPHLDPKQVSTESSTSSKIDINTRETENDGLSQDTQHEALESVAVGNKAGAGTLQLETNHENHDPSTQQDTAWKHPSVTTPIEQMSEKLPPHAPQEMATPLESSTSSLEKTTTSPEPPPPPPKDDKFIPTIKKAELDPEKEAMKSEDAEYTEEANVGQDDQGEGCDDQSEIASIMEQFEDDSGAPGEAEIMSPRLEIGQPFFASPGPHPPRKSSLEPIRMGSPDSMRKSLTLHSPPPRISSLDPSSPVASLRRQSIEDASSPLIPQTSKSLPPPPQPDPEPDLPFDFHRFLEQLRHKSADPVAKYLRSFLLEFGKKPWMVHEQVKIISDFLEFITKKMAQSEVWRTVSDAEFDNAREGMEKLVMNRLYTHTFSPAIPPPAPLPASAKGKRRAGTQPSSPQVGRRGQHQEDVERDEVLAQKVRIYGWVREEHLDIAPIGDKGKKFMTLAQAGLASQKSPLRSL